MPTTTLFSLASSEETPGLSFRRARFPRGKREGTRGIITATKVPGFMVNKSGFNHLYRVYVGPYPDRHSAVDIDTNWHMKRFTGIKSWSPSSKPNTQVLFLRASLDSQGLVFCVSCKAQECFSCHARFPFKRLRRSAVKRDPASDQHNHCRHRHNI